MTGPLDECICPACGEECRVIPLENEFSYTGYGGGIHYPFDWGTPVTDCCEVPVDD